MLSYRTGDFDSDGNQEILAVELEADTLYLRLYRASAEGVILMAEKKENFLSSNLMTEEFVQVFLKHYNGTYFVFYEFYDMAGLVSDGMMWDLRGYCVSDGTLSEIMNENYGGSDFVVEELNAISQRLLAFGLYPVYNESLVSGEMGFNVGEFGREDILVRADQTFHGDSYYDFTMNRESPENVPPMEVVVEIYDDTTVTDGTFGQNEATADMF